MGKTDAPVERVEDRLADFTRDKRVLILSAMALVISAISAVVAYVLVWLIAVITNLAFYQRFSAVFQSPAQNHLGYLVIVVPVVGGLVIGLTARYGSEKIRGHGIPEALEAILFGRSRMSARVAVLKPLSSAISIGTGGPFGAEGPIIMGGALGAFEARFIPIGDAGLWAVISMAALMGGTMRSPLTAMIFTLELTHDLNLLPALLVGCIAAHALTVLMLRRSILTEKVARRGYHISREYSVDPLAVLRVGEVMDANVPTIPARMKVTELSDRIAHRDSQLTDRQSTPIIDEAGRLVGLITRGDVLRAFEQGADGDTTVLDAGSADLIVTYEDELLQDAVTKMLRNDIGRLPVVSRQDPHRLVSYLGRRSVMAARLRRHEEEHVREPGFLAKSGSST